MSTLTVKTNQELYELLPMKVNIGLPKFLPKVIAHNYRLQAAYVDVGQFLSELVQLVRFERFAQQALESRLDFIADQILDRLEMRRETCADDVKLWIDDLYLTLMNAGDELFHQLHHYHLYLPGGYHTYSFEQQTSNDSVLLTKSTWPQLQADVAQYSHWVREHGVR